MSRAKLRFSPGHGWWDSIQFSTKVIFSCASGYLSFVIRGELSSVDDIFMLEPETSLQLINLRPRLEALTAIWLSTSDRLAEIRVPDFGSKIDRGLSVFLGRIGLSDIGFVGNGFNMKRSSQKYFTKVGEGFFHTCSSPSLSCSSPLRNLGTLVSVRKIEVEYWTTNPPG